MKPFNLEEALAGKPVVTRDGKKVTQLHLFSCQSQYPLCGIIENQGIYQFTEKGKYYINELKPENDYDLFMATETVTKWINIFKVSYSKGYETSPCHIITTVRRKQDYEMTKDSNGKTKVEKAGLKEVTREGFEYELTANLELDTRHNATASKDRTGLFMGNASFIPSIETGKAIADWCESGLDVNEEIKQAVDKLSNCNSVDELTMLKETLPEYVAHSSEFKKAGTERYNQILISKLKTA